MGSPLRLGRSLLTLRLNSTSMTSTASCSRETCVYAPLSTTAEIFTIPFLVRSSAICPGSCRFHRPTVIREPCHACQSTHEQCWAISQFAGHHGPSSFVDCITQPWWGAAQTRIVAKVPSWSVSSSVQQLSSLVSSLSGASSSTSLTHLSLGHLVAGCPVPSHTWQCEALFPCP